MIINCQPCIASQLKLSSYDLTKLENIIVRNPPLQKGELLFQCGDRLTALYVIRSGVIKSYKVTSGSGKKQITAFYSMGDVLGLDAINNLCYSTSTKALDTSMVCAIPFEPLERLSNQIPSLRRQLLQLMSRHIQDVQENLSIVKKSAKARTAPSQLAVVGRYVFPAAIWRLLARVTPDQHQEIQLTDAIVKLLAEQPVEAYRLLGGSYDCGNKLGYMQAFVEYGLQHEVLGKPFKDWLDQRVASTGR